MKNTFYILFFFVLLQFPASLFGQVNRTVEKLRYYPGISIEKNFVDLKSFELGANVFATRGRLTNNVINYYGLEASYKWITLMDQNCNGFSLRAIYQNVTYPIGFNVQSSVLIAKKSNFFLPEIGLSLFGVLSLNYGYYFRMDSPQRYHSSLHSLSLKLSINICYGEYLNIVGKSEKWRFKKRNSTNN